ncbi:hypothetical protein BC832DRAFT_425792 [Gaertneriomyces semiglobifer]|nr:hypothetical protein BC832DRAFT_425792 [Gaertneriomyces semiglobifer]
MPSETFALLESSDYRRNLADSRTASSNTETLSPLPLLVVSAGDRTSLLRSGHLASGLRWCRQSPRPVAASESGSARLHSRFLHRNVPLKPSVLESGARPLQACCSLLASVTPGYGPHVPMMTTVLADSLLTMMRRPKVMEAAIRFGVDLEWPRRCPT